MNTKNMIVYSAVIMTIISLVVSQVQTVYIMKKCEGK